MRAGKNLEKEIAAERIRILFEKVSDAAKEKDLPQADYLVSCAREIGMKTKVRIPREYKRLYCKHCYKFISSGIRSKTRVNSKSRRVEVQCLSCGGRMYYPLRG
jgi:ribonuclease P protein subunit RPR2